MRGLMFNSLLDYIESYYGYDIVDTVLEASSIGNEIGYVDGGMYEDADFIKLIESTSITLQIPISQLLVSSGKEIFSSLYQKLLTIYNHDSNKYISIHTVFDFMSILEEIHYKEVVKLYPESTFPHFKVLHRDNSMMEIRYRSERNLPFLAKGLIEGCIEYFNEALTIEMQNDTKKESTHFIIKKERS